MGHGRMQTEPLTCDRERGRTVMNTAPPISQGRDWGIPVSQQEQVLDSGVLEIEEDKRMVCMQWERHTEQEETENPQCVQRTSTDAMRSMTFFCTYRIF